MERNIYYSFLKTDNGISLKIDVSEIFGVFIRQNFKIELVDEFNRIFCIYDYSLKEEILNNESRFFLKFYFYENFFESFDVKELNLVQFDKKNERKVYYSFPIPLCKKGGNYFGKNGFGACKICSGTVG